MSTMITFKDDNLTKFMSKDEIKAKAPFIFATEPTNPAVSDRYVMANTETIIDDMEKLGWGVVDCRQQRANKRSNINSFHLVAFQNPNVVITKTNEDGVEVADCYPRILITTSHDGKRSLSIHCAIFRLVCSNGLVVATEDFGKITLKHINYSFEELRKVVAEFITNVDKQIVVMNDMQNTELNDEQKADFVTKALRIRKGVKDDEKFEVDSETIADILTPVRKEDESNKLWNVFNVIQEKMMHGNYQMVSPTNGRVRKARAIKGLAKDLDLNTKLFRTASSYIPMAC